MSSNARSFAALQGMIRRVREVGGIAADVAPRVAERLKEEIAANLARGVDPGGATLEPTKAGKRPLQNAARALSASALGSVAIVRLEGPAVRHHQGSARGGTRRQILPSRGRLGPVVDAMRAVVTERFGEIMRGESSDKRRP